MSSIRLRFTLVSAISICIVVGLIGVALASLFSNYVESKLKSELEYQLFQVTNNIRLVSESRVEVGGSLDPRFDDPLSGLYWIVEVDGGERELSASLWSEGFALEPEAAGSGKIAHVVQQRPAQTPISIAHWTVVQGFEGRNVSVHVAAAADRAGTLAAMAEFRTSLTLWLSALVLILVAAAAAQIVLGLRPMEALRAKVEAVKSGELKRLSGDYPNEVMPLVDEVNELLDSQDEALRLARQRAGDLAHGLKTPITVLSAISRELLRAGRTTEAEGIAEQVTLMDGHLQGELNRARIASQHLASSDLPYSVDRVVRAMKKVQADKAIAWKLDMPDELSVPVDQQDLSEVLGTVLDNARKWTRSIVQVRAARNGSSAFLEIEDDGAGVPDAVVSRLTERGYRLDTAMPGSGLGLAIASDVMAAYSGDMQFYRAASGGLGVKLTWPLQRR